MWAVCFVGIDSWDTEARDGIGSGGEACQGGGGFVDGRGVQLRKSQLKRGQPSCPIDGSHAIHVHGSYDRYGDCDGDTKDLNIPRYLCVACGHTISVLPDDVLPYRAVRAEQVERHFHERVDGPPPLPPPLSGPTRPPPPPTEKEKGCLKRAWCFFERHTTKLTAVLGQIIARVKPNDGAGLWKQLRQLGNLEVILKLLADRFKTSLLRDYLCLQPWPAPE